MSRKTEDLGHEEPWLRCGEVKLVQSAVCSCRSVKPLVSSRLSERRLVPATGGCCEPCSLPSGLLPSLHQTALNELDLSTSRPSYFVAKVLRLAAHPDLQSLFLAHPRRKASPHNPLLHGFCKFAAVAFVFFVSSFSRRRG
ncbi:hypothetical protein Bca4012_066019 [Brassica carinata]|uniref:Uncharacterized protein n=1 Tax=Brassica carinata TaxID=52824 RepID=A0A8X8AWB3_BRACI|nr:hypothetical protein Bca52824_018341 [Brassica carinata]